MTGLRCEHEDGSGFWLGALQCPDPATAKVRVWMDGYAWEDLDLCSTHAEAAVRSDPTKVEKL